MPAIGMMRGDIAVYVTSRHSHTHGLTCFDILITVPL